MLYAVYNCIQKYKYLLKGANAMLEISNKTNLLEQKSYKYSLQDVAMPNLQRDLYSYGSLFLRNSSQGGI